MDQLSAQGITSLGSVSILSGLLLGAQVGLAAGIGALAIPAGIALAGVALAVKGYSLIDNAGQRSEINDLVQRLPEGTTLQEARADLLVANRIKRENIIEKHHQRIIRTKGFTAS